MLPTVSLDLAYDQLDGHSTSVNSGSKKESSWENNFEYTQRNSSVLLEMALRHKKNRWNVEQMTGHGRMKVE